jgi:hypothetical protein
VKPISKQPDPDREAIETVPQLHQTNTTFTRRWHGTEQLGMARIMSTSYMRFVVLIGQFR